eukprot:GHRR01031114.1.p1 GENE.GHRR01031114.1~~GHRR01031114.1.p1  ORF type:complete len:150 (+),score=51.63 GHRR01031114.1:137-586(+)
MPQCGAPMTTQAPSQACNMFKVQLAYGASAHAVQGVTWVAVWWDSGHVVCMLQSLAHTVPASLLHFTVFADLLADEAPFQAIHVGAAADELHQVLLDKLAPGGRMVIPVGPRYSYQVCSLPCPPSPAALLIKFSRCSCAQWQCTMLHNQ